MICEVVRLPGSESGSSMKIGLIAYYVLINSGNILFFLSQPLNVASLSKTCNLGIWGPCGGDMMKFFFLVFFLKINISGAIHKEYLIYKCVSDVVLLMLKTASTKMANGNFLPCVIYCIPC